MIIYNQIKTYLEKEPRARERRNYQRAMVNLLLIKYPDLKEIPKEKLVNFCHDFESYCRIWRQVTEQNEHLRGKDYETKRIMEENKMLELGYDPLYNKKIYA